MEGDFWHPAIQEAVCDQHQTPFMLSYTVDTRSYPSCNYLFFFLFSFSNVNLQFIMQSGFPLKLHPKRIECTWSTKVTWRCHQHNKELPISIVKQACCHLTADNLCPLSRIWKFSNVYCLAVRRKRLFLCKKLITWQVMTDCTSEENDMKSVGVVVIIRFCHCKISLGGCKSLKNPLCLWILQFERRKLSGISNSWPMWQNLWIHEADGRAAL